MKKSPDYLPETVVVKRIYPNSRIVSTEYFADFDPIDRSGFVQVKTVFEHNGKLYRHMLYNLGMKKVARF